jgi:hypothetical protein
MGRGAGGGTGIGGGGSYAKNPNLSTAEGREEQKRLLELSNMLSPLNNIKDPNVKAEIKEALESYSKEIGLPYEVQIIASDLAKGRLGATDGGGSITLNTKYFNKSAKNAEKELSDRMKAGKGVTTNKPLQSTVHHELAHNTYSKLSGAKKDAVGALYKKYMSDKKVKGWGSYSKKNAEEFYAEGIAKSMTGKSDSYTKALRKLTW